MAKSFFFSIYQHIDIQRAERGYYSTPEAFKRSFVILHTDIYPGKKEKTDVKKLIFDHLVFFSHLAMLSDLRAVGELYQDPFLLHRQPAFHYGPGQPHYPALIIHFPMSSGESE